MDAAIDNPLFGIQTGSIMFAETGRFQVPVINDGLTKFISQQSGAMSMTGNSDYVYSDHMNQGSLSVSGAYGVSGVSKLSAAVTAYVGNTTAESHNNLSIALNCVKWCGVEYIDFNALTVSQLMAGLKENVRKRAEEVLDKYVAMLKATKPEQIAEILKGKGDPEAKKAFDAWHAAAADFLATYGTGMVVGVLWGGWGAVKLDFTNTNKETRWKAGGSGQFTYASAGAAVDVSATYGHSESAIGQTAKVDVTAFYNGACMEKIVGEWFTDLKTKAANKLELGKESVTRNAVLSEAIAAPKVPEFLKPEKPKRVTDLIGQIKTLDGLQAYAKAAAWEKYKADGGKQELADFLVNADKKNDAAAVPTVKKASQIVLDDDDEADYIIESAVGATRAAYRPHDAGLARDAGKAAPPKPGEPQGNAVFKNFEPMGIWVANWSQLFPWLVSGHSNEIPKTNHATSLVVLKIVSQDFLTLQKLYQRLASSGLTVRSFGPTQFQEISNSFAHASGACAEFVTKETTSRTRADKGPSISRFVNDVRGGLSANARTIYEAWWKTGLLRTGELGFGIVLKTSDARLPGVHSITGRDISQFPDTFPPHLERCDFELKARNFDAFSRFVKGFPVLLPSGEIVVYLNTTDINASGVLCQHAMMGANIVRQLSPDDRINTAIEFHATTEGADTAGARTPLQFLKGGFTAVGVTFEVLLYPLPFEAARGVTWSGCAMATGHGTLEARLEDVRSTLEQRNRWSFDSDYWNNRNWRDEAYSMQGLSLSYLGVTPEPKNIMPGGRDAVPTTGSPAR